MNAKRSINRKGVNLLKDIGIVRAIDELGRIVLPKELRKTMDMQPKDKLEIYVEGQQVVIKKYYTSCAICGNQDTKDLLEVNEKLICQDCATKISLALTVKEVG